MDDNIKIIKELLASAVGESTPQAIYSTINNIIIQLEKYLYNLDFFYGMIENEARKKIDTYENAGAQDVTVSYGLYKSLSKYEVEATTLLKEGYVLLDVLRNFFTNEVITYDIGFTSGRGKSKQLYEMKLTIEELLSFSTASYNTRSSIDNLYKLRMQVTKGDLVQAYNKFKGEVEPLDDGSSTIWSSIHKYLGTQKINQGNVYEAYKVYKAEIGTNMIPPAEFQEKEFDEILTRIRQNTASSTLGGDYILEQFKYFSSSPSLITTSNIRNTLHSILNLFKDIKSGKDRQKIIEEAKKMFLKSGDQISAKAEIEAVEVASEHLEQLIKNLTS